MYLNQTKLRQFNEQIRLTSNFKNILVEKMCYFQQNMLYEDPDSIEELAGKINKRQMQNCLKEMPSENAFCHRWVFGEKKVFCWALIFFSHFQSIALQDLHQASRAEIDAIFVRKHPIFIRYEMIRLLNRKMGKKVPWIESEVALFRQAANSFTEVNDWKAISFDLFFRSQGEIFRSPNECREKWCNFLNPSLKRESWSLEQDLKLFELVQRYGCRWAMISREFGESRTQHMVKNRVNLFYSSWQSKKKCFNTNKKGIFSRIYLYLKKRMIKSKKGSMAAMQEISAGRDLERGEYGCLQYHESSKAKQEAIANTSHQLPVHLLYSKEEKRTLDEEELHPTNSDLPGTKKASENLILQQPENFLDLFCQDLSITSRQPQRVEMRVVEDEVARALGCQHFQRLPYQQFQLEQAQGEESFCWL